MNIELTSVKPQQKDMDHRTDSMALYESRELIVLDKAMIDGDLLRSIATLRVYGGKSRGSSRRIANFWLSVPSSSKRCEPGVDCFRTMREAIASAKATAAHHGLTYVGRIH